MSTMINTNESSIGVFIRYSTMSARLPIKPRSVRFILRLSCFAIPICPNVVSIATPLFWEILIAPVVIKVALSTTIPAASKMRLLRNPSFNSCSKITRTSLNIAIPLLVDFSLGNPCNIAKRCSCGKTLLPKKSKMTASLCLDGTVVRSLFRCGGSSAMVKQRESATTFFLRNGVLH